MPGIGSAAQDPADFEAAQNREVQVEDDEVGRTGRHRPERRIAARHDLRIVIPPTLERMLDERRDVVFVLDDEHVMFSDPHHATVLDRRFTVVSKLLNVGYRGV